MTKTIERPGLLLPEIDDVTRREFLVGAAGLLLLPAGCGGGEQDEGEASGETRAVRHALGETEVPLDPRRVVVGNQIGLEAALALGAPVVGAATPNLAGARGRQFEGRLEGIEPVGTEGEPNVEKVAALEPDLIIGFTWGGFEELYETYSRVAPTVVIGLEDHNGWKGDLREMAGALGKREEARRAISDYDARVERLREALGDRLEETAVSVIRFYAGYANSEFRTRHASFPGSILEDVGFPQPPAQRRASDPSDPEQYYVEVSLERVELLDGDAIFAALDPGSEDAFETFQESPLWQRLEAVRNDRVYPVDSGYWIFGSVLSANAILDDLEKHLVEGE